MKSFLKFIVEAEELETAELVYKGTRFKTGTPVTFPYVRNNESAAGMKLPKHVAAQYQVDIEPAGRYLSFDDDPKYPAAPGWEKGEVTFRNPLVIPLNSAGDAGRIYDENSWKKNLQRHFKKNGRALSSALKSKGYDGIVTVTSKYPSEIVQLF